jgi:hypothetical protein
MTTQTCECGRPPGQCIKGDLDRCPSEDDDVVMICPVTKQPCLTELDEHCEDYGCAREAGIAVDGDWN